MAVDQSPRLSVVFAGGGCRTFWSLGAIHELKNLLGEVREWAGVSAGAAMAITSCLGLAEVTLDHFIAATAANAKNVYWSNAFKSRPVFPHETMYRTAIKTVLGPSGFEALQRSAPVRIFLASINAGAPRSRTMLRVMRSYRQRKIRQIVHGPDVTPADLSTEIVTAQDAKTLEELCDLILASSSTPPVTKAPVVDGRMYVDGGFAENVPVRALSREARDGKVIVLLTRPIPRHLLPSSAKRLYLAPSGPIPIATWDYTNPQKLKETFAQGRRDAVGEQKVIEVFCSTY